MITVDAKFVANNLTAEEITAALEMRLAADAAASREAEAEARKAEKRLREAEDAMAAAQARAEEVSQHTAAALPTLEALRQAATATTWTARPVYPINASGKPVSATSKAAAEYTQAERQRAAQMESDDGRAESKRPARLD